MSSSLIVSQLINKTNRNDEILFPSSFELQIEVLMHLMNKLRLYTEMSFLFEREEEYRLVRESGHLRIVLLLSPI